MRIYRYELKKLLTTRAVLAIVALCLLLNVVIAMTATFGEIDLEDTFLPPNVFETFETAPVAEKYIAAQNAEGIVADMYRDKYADLQTVVDEKAKRGDAVSVYFGEYTYYFHKEIFGKLMMWLLMEGMLLAMLLSILSLGWEQINRTELLTYSTKIGRRLILMKILASLTAGIGFYIFIAALALGFFFLQNDFSDVWNANVSSGYNYILDLVTGVRPFTTWHNFTVRGFLFAHLGISTGLVACSSLMGAAAGIIAKNSYIGVLGAVLVNVVCAVIPSIVTSALYAKYLFVLTPVNLWLRTRFWFTDGLMDVLWRNFETLGLCLSLGVTLCVLLVTVVGFRRKDLV
jgi:hypothetical protein